MMSRLILFSLLTHYIFTTTNPLQPPTDPPIQLILPSSLNASSSDNGNGNGKLYVDCNGPSYGSNLDLVDCLDAREYVIYNAKQFAFAQRHTGQEEATYPLPYRLMGGAWLTATFDPRWTCLLLPQSHVDGFLMC